MATQRKLTELAAGLFSAQKPTLERLERERPDDHEAHIKSHKALALCYWWTEQYEPAQFHWRRCLELGERHLEQYLAQGGSPYPHWHVQYTLPAFQSATFLGEAERAMRLLEQTEMLSAGLLPGMERPLHPHNWPDRYGIYPNDRAYCLLRLRKTDGFHAATFTRQWPDVKEEEAAWREATVFDLLHTSEMCMLRARAEGDEVFSDEKMKLPLYRAIARYLESPSPGLQKEAQKALVEYLGKITHAGHFWNNLPIALDLQTAFADIFSPVLAPARPV